MAPLRKSKTWNVGNMNEALGAVIRLEMGYLKASKYYDVPRTTLSRYVKQTATKLARKPVFPPNLKTNLAQRCLLMEERFYGIIWAELRRVTYCLAVNNNLPNIFNVKNESIGKEWLSGPLKCHAEIL
jgi:hypothetical protein